MTVSMLLFPSSQVNPSLLSSPYTTMSVLFTSPLAQEDDVVQEKSPNHHVEIEPSDPIVEMGEMGFQRDARLDRKVVLKLDLLLLPVMCTIFVLLFLDRANIGNARVAGLQKDLHLTGRQYQIGVCYGHFRLSPVTVH